MKKVILVDDVIKRVMWLSSEAEKAGDVIAYAYLSDLYRWLEMSS